MQVFFFLFLIRFGQINFFSSMTFSLPRLSKDAFKALSLSLTLIASSQNQLNSGS